MKINNEYIEKLYEDGQITYMEKEILLNVNNNKKFWLGLV